MSVADSNLLLTTTQQHIYAAGGIGQVVTKYGEMTRIFRKARADLETRMGSQILWHRTDAANVLKQFYVNTRINTIQLPVGALASIVHQLGGYDKCEREQLWKLVALKCEMQDPDADFLLRLSFQRQNHIPENSNRRQRRKLARVQISGADVPFPTEPTAGQVLNLTKAATIGQWSLAEPKVPTASSSKCIYLLASLTISNSCVHRQG